MSKQSLQARYLAALLARGETIARSSPRCITVTRHTLDNVQRGFYYLGTGGSLRTGPTKKTSVPVNQTFKDRLLADNAPAPASTTVFVKG